MYKSIPNGELISNMSCTMQEFNNHHTTGVTNSYDQHCIGYIFAGNVRILMPGCELSAKAGDLLYISRKSRYSSLWDGSPDIRYLDIRFDFQTRSSHSELGLQIVKDYPAAPLVRLENARHDNPILAVAEFYGILHDLYRHHLKPTRTSAGQVLPALHYIEDHASEIIPVEMLAGLCCMSVSHFHAVFRQETGTTPIRYRHTILVNLAIERLLHTDDSIEAISEELGFCSSCYFRRIFAAITGKTPKEIRK